jgi:Spy/CpxP family protein refolding chaperone
LVGAAAAQPGEPRGRRPGHVPEGLGLSDEQKAQWQELRQKNREALRPLVESARQAHKAYRDALEAANPDAATVGNAALAARAADEKLREARQASFKELKSILTPEQLEKLEQSTRRGGRRRGEGGPRTRG